MDLRWIVLLLSNYLLLALLGELNGALAGFGIHLLPAGLFVTYAAMRLSYRAGLYATLGTGLLLDAARPTPWGLQLFTLLALYTLIVTARSSLGLGELWRLFIIACAATPVFLVVLSLGAAGERPDLAAYAGRCASDTLLSTGFTALTAHWWFTLQESLLDLLGFDRRAESAETA